MSKRKPNKNVRRSLTRSRNPQLPAIARQNARLLNDIKARIQTSQLKAALSVNRELIALYWHIGRSIVERQRVDGWGRSVVERLSRDVQKSFPGISGFSPQNIWNMRAFFLAWTDQVAKL